MIPVSLSSSLGLRRPVLDQVMTYAKARLGTELKELAPIVIESRLKSEASILSKLQTGRYGSIHDLRDLIGVKVVLLYRKQLAEAIQIVRVCAGNCANASAKASEAMPRIGRLSASGR